MSNKIAGKDVQVFVGGYDLTGDHNRITLEDRRNTYDVTAFSDEVRQFIVGPRQTRLTHEGYLNPAASRSHPVLKAVDVGGIVSVLVGDNNRAYSLPVRQGRYRSMPKVGNYVPFTAAFATRGEPGGWGYALREPDDFTSGFTEISVDTASMTGNGGAAFLHLLTAAASDTCVFTVEGSTTGAFAGEETVLATFSMNGSAVGSERVAISSTLPQYARAKAVRTGAAGDVMNVAITLVRFE
ncbi:MAG: hypothetical protein AAF653_09945 [Chloroflexota bacterium]